MLVLFVHNVSIVLIQFSIAVALKHIFTTRHFRHQAYERDLNQVREARVHQPRPDSSKSPKPDAGQHRAFVMVPR
jgi:hypothetical protein